MAKTTKTTKKTAVKKAQAPKAPAKKKPTAKKSAPKKVSAKKAPVKKTTAKKTVAKKKIPATKHAQKTTATRPTGRTIRQISADERRQMISEAAYLRGEAQGFLSDEREDWILAEAEIDARLQKAAIKVIG